MPLTAGTQVGPYRIVGLIGAGGMGEVYRATDGRLARDVAIKVIHETLAADPSRVRRFEQEARAAGQLNHPNILAVHDFGTHAGAPYIVSELLEGESLRARLQRGPLPLRETIDYARQVADGLAAAHAKGIVHRDLKPDNLFLTKDGRVKILDFGIAKLAPIGDDASAPTEVAGETAEGMVVGTLGYMSPEQLRGETVDQRSDLFSLGAILFEMITGRQAFVRATAAETMAAALKEDPLEKIDGGVSPTLSRLVSRCLEKAREMRFQSARDLAFAMEVLSGTNEIAAPGPAVAAPRRRSRLTLAIGVFTIVVVAAVAIWLARDHGAASTDNLLANATFRQLTNFESSEEDASISPDGKFVIFLSDRDGPFHIWRTQLGSGDFTDLTPGGDDQSNPGAIRAAGFTGDGFEIWLSGSTNRRFRLMPLLGGAPHAFLEEKTVNAAWAHDGKRFVYFTYEPGDPTMVMDGSHGKPHQIWIDPKGDHNHFPAWSVDDKWIYFARGSQFPAEFDIWRISPEGGEPQQLTHLKTYIRYVTPIDLRTVLYVAPDEDETGPWLWALDVEQHTTRRLSVGLEQYLSVSASADGRHLVASVANPTASLWTVPILDRTIDEREVKPYPGAAARALAPRFDKTALFYLSSTGERDGLFRLQDGKSVEFWKGSDGALAAPVAVSPKNDWIVVAPIRQGKRHLLLLSADGASNRSLSEDVDVRGTTSWSPDGNWIVTGGNNAQGPGLFLVPFDGGAPRKIRSGPAFDPVWSPTDDVILYTGQQNAGAPLLATHADGTPVDGFPEIRVPFGGGGRVRFLPDGKSIVYIQRSASGMDFWLMDLFTKIPRQITHLASPATMFAFDITADGRHIVFDRIRQNSDLRLIDLAK